MFCDDHSVLFIVKVGFVLGKGHNPLQTKSYHMKNQKSAI